MLDCLLIVAGGLLGSGHCIGMCGGFVLTIGMRAPSWRTNLVRQLVYAAGRISIYTLAGAILGFGAWRIGHDLHTLVNVQALLSLAAGLLLFVEGVFALGWLRRPFHATACPGAATFASLLRSRATSAVFVAGLANGLLPCGLVYAYLALAASAGHVLRGGLVMALFGLGTLPALVLTGLSGSLLGVIWRRRLFHFAAWCLIITGVLALGRGFGFIQLHQAEATVCPFCVE